MLNETSDNKYLKLALPMGEIKVPKFLYVIVAVLLVLILIVGGLNIYIQKSKNTKVAKLPSPTLYANSSKLIKEKLVLDWIGTQKDKDGLYWSNYNCEKSPDFVCKNRTSNNYTGIPVMWGESKYYLATKDEGVLENLKNDIKNYSSDNKALVIGTYNLSCKLINDMLNEPIWNDKEKESLKKICMKTDIIADRLSKYMWENPAITQDKIKMETDAKLASILASGKENKYYSDYAKAIEAEGPLDFYPSMSTEFIEKYKMSGDTPLLNRARFITDVLLENYLNHKLLADSKCRMGRNLLEFYDLEKNLNYLAVSKKIYDENKNMSALDCSMLGSDLYKSTKQEEYKTYLSQKLLNDGGYDFLQNDQVTAFIFSESENNVNIELDKNAILIGLLSSEITK